MMPSFNFYTANVNQFVERWSSGVTVLKCENLHLCDYINAYVLDLYKGVAEM